MRACKTNGIYILFYVNGVIKETLLEYYELILFQLFFKSELYYITLGRRLLPHTKTSIMRRRFLMKNV